MKPSHRKIADQLHRGNAGVPHWFRDAFYLAKERLCRRLGTIVDYDIQEIRHACWDCNGTGRRQETSPDWLQWPKGTPLACFKCAGTGIYQKRKIYLERWRIGPYVFHRPHHNSHYMRLQDPPTIIGRIVHEPYPDSALCALRLAFLYARDELEASARCHCRSQFDPAEFPQSHPITRQVKAWMLHELALIGAFGQSEQATAEKMSQAVPF